MAKMKDILKYRQFRKYILVMYISESQNREKKKVKACTSINNNKPTNCWNYIPRFKVTNSWKTLYSNIKVSNRENFLKSTKNSMHIHERNHKDQVISSFSSGNIQSK